MSVFYYSIHRALVDERYEGYKSLPFLFQYLSISQFTEPTAASMLTFMNSTVPYFANVSYTSLWVTPIGKSFTNTLGRSSGSCLELWDKLSTSSLVSKFTWACFSLKCGLSFQLLFHCPRSVENCDFEGALELETFQMPPQLRKLLL